MEQKGPVQRIAVTVWGERVSPVFDAARNLLIAELVEGSIASLSSLEFDPARPLQLVQLLRARNIAVFICGAVSEGPAGILEAGGIRLIPFIAGDVREVLATFSRGRQEWSEFTMPGCDRKICCRGKIRRGLELPGHLPHGRQGEDERRLSEAATDRAGRNNGGADACENPAEEAGQGGNTAADEE
jgi:predicted Fe-Mo cluster-binding NifX family protein